MALTLVTPPAVDPILLSEAKSFMRITHNLEDDIITASIKAATKWIEELYSLAFVQQTWDLWLDNWPQKDYIEIKKRPVQSIEFIKYFGTDNTEYTFSVDNYELDNKSFVPRVVLKYDKTWPDVTLKPANGVQIRFVAGYPLLGENPDIPEDKKLPLKLAISIFTQYREAEEELQKALKVVGYLITDRVWPV